MVAGRKNKQLFFFFKQDVFDPDFHNSTLFHLFGVWGAVIKCFSTSADLQGPNCAKSRKNLRQRSARKSAAKQFTLSLASPHGCMTHLLHLNDECNSFSPQCPFQDRPASGHKAPLCTVIRNDGTFRGMWLHRCRCLFRCPS